MEEPVPKTDDLPNVKLSGRPVVISDVDDVVLKFIEPFQAFLETQSLRFLPRSFRLTGNIVRIETNIPVGEESVRDLLDAFFRAQKDWQTPFDHALATLEKLDAIADIVFLTAMPPQFTRQRRELLVSFGLDHALVATRQAKGPVANQILKTSSAKCVFLDDMAHNITSVGEHVPGCLLIHMPPDSEVHDFAPKAAAGVPKAADWREAYDMIASYFAS